MEIICKITGQVRHRRKLAKHLFFIDIQPEDKSEKSQVFFRSDDDSQNVFAVQDAYKRCKPGNIIMIQVGKPLDPSEQENKEYKVWQSDRPVKVIELYTSNTPFVQDRPLATDQTKKDLRQTDGTVAEKSTIICKYWINKNICVKGVECPFLHPKGDDLHEKRKAWVSERVEKRQKLSDPEDPHKSKKPHALRAVIFAIWLKTKFELSSSGVVLDIAGGKGEVSMFLSRGFGIPSVVVDPKERKRTNYWFGRLRRLMHRYETGTLESSDYSYQDMDAFDQNWPNEIEPEYMHTYLNDSFITESQELVSKASLCIGLHPDQATVPIVDMAIKMRKPFAVIPCCVFSQENQLRKLKSGEVVVTTEQMIQYICEKEVPSGEIKIDYLSFEGKNKVVYWKP